MKRLVFLVIGMVVSFIFLLFTLLKNAEKSRLKNSTAMETGLKIRIQPSLQNQKRLKK